MQQKVATTQSVWRNFQETKEDWTHNMKCVGVYISAPNFAQILLSIPRKILCCFTTPNCDPLHYVTMVPYGCIRKFHFPILKVRTPSETYKYLVFVNLSTIMYYCLELATNWKNIIVCNLRNCIVFIITNLRNFWMKLGWLNRNYLTEYQVLMFKHIAAEYRKTAKRNLSKSGRNLF